MKSLSHLQPAQVFAYFEEISAVPRGSGNRQAIAAYCEAFARRLGLKCVHDEAHNVILYKQGSKGRENEPPVILQGHLDMVCQKEADCSIDFDTEGLSLYIDGDDLRARGTTLGADNGIAVAMILSILERDDLSHPPIEAVFTADEEIGMLGAAELDMSLLKARRMINLDAEEDDTLTVSCAGGSDVLLTVDFTRHTMQGTAFTVSIDGLKGGHSGVEIHHNRVNADKLMGRFLCEAVGGGHAALISVNGGDKANAIPRACRAVLCTEEADAFAAFADAWFAKEAQTLLTREPAFAYTVTPSDPASHAMIRAADAARLIALLNMTPDGVVQMSEEIDGLVETSLNLGVLCTEDDRTLLRFALRSNKATALTLLECTLLNAANGTADRAETSGHYPPWEFKADSALQQQFIAAYTAQYGTAPKVEAIHAGLECAVFASKLEGLDCIAIGPALRDVHTPSEALSISSTEQTYRLLCSLLETL